MSDQVAVVGPPYDTTLIARHGLRRDENDPARSFAEIAARPATSGILIQQTGPDGETHTGTGPVLHPAASPPRTGACGAEVMCFSGRTQLPLAAVVSFTPDPTARERGNTAFAPPSRES
jgi:hypothetical protein